MYYSAQTFRFNHTYLCIMHRALRIGHCIAHCALHYALDRLASIIYLFAAHVSQT